MVRKGRGKLPPSCAAQQSLRAAHRSQPRTLPGQGRSLSKIPSAFPSLLFYYIIKLEIKLARTKGLILAQLIENI